MNLKNKLRKYRKKEIKRRYKQFKKFIWQKIKTSIKPYYSSYDFEKENKFIYWLLKKYFEKEGFHVVFGDHYFSVFWGKDELK